MTRSAMLLAALAALGAGCGGKKDKDTSGDTTGSATAPVPRETADELAGKPLKTVTAHAGALEFSIDLPEAASAPQADGDTAVFAFKDSTLRLAITGRTAKIAADELAQKHELSPDGKAKGTEELVRADQTSADSYAVAKKRKDGTWFLTESCRNVPTGSVCCAATLTTAKPYPGLVTVLTWSESVCQHLTVAGEPHAAPPPPPDSKTRKPG